MYTAKTRNKALSGEYKQCLQCKQDVYVTPYRLATFRFCSTKCGFNYKNEHERVGLSCQICSAAFTVIAHREKTAKYCSRECYYKSMVNVGSIEFKCHHCDNPFYGSPSHIGKRKYCSRACVSKENHKTFKPSYTTVRGTMWRRGLIKVCNRCGYDKEPKILGVHHRDRNRENNALENLEVLCPTCHSMEHLRHIVCHQ